MAEDPLSHFAHTLRPYRWAMTAACPVMIVIGVVTLHDGWEAVVAFILAGAALLGAAHARYLERRTARRIAERG